MENPVEILAALFFLTASVMAAMIALKSKKQIGWSRSVQFFALYSTVALLMFLEVVSYGQRLLGYETPDIMKAINIQDEMTLHNIWGRTENPRRSTSRSAYSR